VRRFEKAPWINKYQWEPKSGPCSAKSENRIPAAYPSKKRRDDNKREQHQHDRDKKNKSINAIDPLKELYNDIH
jgi:hypothetical protein